MTTDRDPDPGSDGDDTSLVLLADALGDLIAHLITPDLPMTDPETSPR